MKIIGTTLVLATIVSGSILFFISSRQSESMKTDLQDELGKIHELDTSEFFSASCASTLHFDSSMIVSALLVNRKTFDDGKFQQDTEAMNNVNNKEPRLPQLRSYREQKVNYLNFFDNIKA